MTEADLRRIEAAIGRPLSAAVRRFFLNYPEELRTTTRELGGEDKGGGPFTECPADYELCGEADGIIKMNGPGGLVYGDWPASRLVVGAGGCGETYWVDLDDEKGAVYRFEAGQQDDSDEVAGSLEDFAEGLIEAYRGG
jgi:hypothetical protein